MCQINAPKRNQMNTHPVDERISYVHCENDQFDQEERRYAPCNVLQVDYHWKTNEDTTVSPRIMRICH